MVGMRKSTSCGQAPLDRQDPSNHSLSSTQRASAGRVDPICSSKSLLVVELTGFLKLTGLIIAIVSKKMKLIFIPVCAQTLIFQKRIIVEAMIEMFVNKLQMSHRTSSELNQVTG